MKITSGLIQKEEIALGYFLPEQEKYKLHILWSREGSQIIDYQFFKKELQDIIKRYLDTNDDLSLYYKAFPRFRYIKDMAKRTLYLPSNIKINSMPESYIVDSLDLIELYSNRALNIEHTVAEDLDSGKYAELIKKYGKKFPKFRI